MSNKRDYYDTLGVARAASGDEIKRAYRRLAKEFHPDRNPDNAGAEAKFKEVQQAYTVLSDEKKRAQYDQFGEVGVGEWATQPDGERVYHWGGSTVGVDDLEDLLSSFGSGQRPSTLDDLFGGIFGGNRKASAAQPAPRRSADQTQRIELSFEQAIHGATISLTLRSRGNGKSQTLDVKIPPGVEDEQKLRLKGRIPGAGGGPPGDLYLQCSIRPHAYFRRHGADVYVDVPISVTESVLGAQVEVPSLDGRTLVTIPPATPSGAKLRLKGHGIARTSGDRGDQFVVIQIVPPGDLTEQQRELFAKLHEAQTSNPRAECPWEA